jgi:hypothetical protein
MTHQLVERPEGFTANRVLAPFQNTRLLHRRDSFIRKIDRNCVEHVTWVCPPFGLRVVENLHITNGCVSPQGTGDNDTFARWVQPAHHFRCDRLVS